MDPDAIAENVRPSKIQPRLSNGMHLFVDHQFLRQCSHQRMECGFSACAPACALLFSHRHLQCHQAAGYRSPSFCLSSK
jgi:hypothetical protein